MDLIIDFYKNLDTLNLIIFWGIIIVIILLLIFSLILISKNKKLKKLVATQTKYEEEIPIKQQELKQEDISKNDQISEIETKSEEPSEIIKMENNIDNSIQIEKDFVAEELVSGYHIKENSISDNSKTTEKGRPYQTITTNNIEIPNKPYQRNVLREMSLSQTSPIGINRTNIKEDKKMEMIKDLEESLNDTKVEIEQKKEQPIDNKQKVDNTLKQELSNIKEETTRKTEIKNESIIKMNESYNNRIKEVPEYQTGDDTAKIKVTEQHNILENYQDLPKNQDERKEKKSSEKYLEEVSRKLAEAEVPDEIERTNYEIKQEEDAIISYKELMEKKDTIQTIDEEEAVISIEELMNRENKKQEEPHIETKLYNLGEEEENDSFIKELKQFRNDL